MATHSSILAWRILWTQKPGGLLHIGCKELTIKTLFLSYFDNHTSCPKTSGLVLPDGWDKWYPGQQGSNSLLASLEVTTRHYASLGVSVMAILLENCWF